MVIPVAYCDHYPIPLPPGHKFPVQKYLLTRELLAADARFELIPAEILSTEAAELAHDRAYVRAVLDGSVDPRIMRRIGFPWSEGLVWRTLASAGGTLAAARRSLR